MHLPNPIIVHLSSITQDDTRVLTLVEFEFAIGSPLTVVRGQRTDHRSQRLLILIYILILIEFAIVNVP